jgi:hypothetical protein
VILGHAQGGSGEAQHILFQAIAGRYSLGGARRGVGGLRREPSFGALDQLTLQHVPHSSA